MELQQQHHHHQLQRNSWRLSAEVLLPMSFALSRPIHTMLSPEESHTGLLLVLFVVLHCMCRLFDRVLHGIAEAERPDALVFTLSVIFQVLGSASMWLAAQNSVVLGSLHLPLTAASFTHETMLGLLGVAGTTFAFLLPRILRARRDGRLLSLAAPWRWLELRGGVPSSGGGSPGNPEGDMFSPDSDAFSGDFSRAGGPAAALASNGDGFGSQRGFGDGAAAYGLTTSVAQQANELPAVGRRGEERRELFGVRRRMKALVRAAGSLVLDDKDEHTDDDDGDGGGGGAGGGGGGRDPRRRGASIVAKTEAMAAISLAAKNDELERITAAKAELVAGISEVLTVLWGATQAVEDARTHDDARSIVSSQRQLLNAALQAQAWLQSLLQTHGDGHEMEAPRTPTLRPVAPRTPPMPPSAPGLAPAGAGPVPHREPGQRGGSAQDEPAMTWTSALGVDDVHARLYADTEHTHPHGPTLTERESTS
jgi:hypothetical protein